VNAGDVLKLATIAGMIGLVIYNPDGVKNALALILGILGDMFRVVTKPLGGAGRDIGR
jgi:hypothetical protein